VPSSPNDAEQVVDELNVLMAGGRLHDESRQVLIRAFQEKIAAGLTAGEALTAAQELMTFSSEYHTRSRRLPVGPRAPEVKSSTPHPSGFRGIVYIFLDGGADSYSLVVPKNDCPARDLCADMRRDLLA
jgi:cullin-associated NEDD8-dissociated protein 1